MDSRRYNLRERKGFGGPAERKPRTGKRQAEGDGGGTEGRKKARVEGNNVEGKNVEETNPRKRKSNKIRVAETAQSPVAEEREVKRLRTPDQNLPTPRSESPKAKESPPTPLSLPTIEIWPPEASHSNPLPLDETTKSTDPTILEPPFEYTPPARVKRSGIPELLEVEPEFARVLEYVAPQNEGSSHVQGLDILAGVASQDLSTLSIPTAAELENSDSSVVVGNGPGFTVTTETASTQALDMQEIVPGLFLGSCSVLHPSRLTSFRVHGIKHILTLRRQDESVEPWETESVSILENDPSITRKWLDIADSPYEKLLTTRLLPRITREIKRSILSKEPVFVHCEMGRSRSVAIVLAYLMKYHSMDFNTAFEYVQSKRRGINPNPGFVQQLLVWDYIKHDWNNQSQYAAFQHWKRAYKSGVISCNYDKYGGRAILLPHAPVPREFISESSPLLSGTPTLQHQIKDGYVCSNCGYHLAPETASFGFTKDHGESCTQVFLGYQMNWMELDPESPGGKLKCPGCDETVGEYAWLGLQCEDCGEIVSPGLALVRRGNVELMQFSEREGMGFRVDDQDMNEESDPFPRESPVTGMVTTKEEVKTDLSTYQILLSELHAVQQRPELYPVRQLPAPEPRKRKPIIRPTVLVPSIRRFLPRIPSPLRNTWFPRSELSSPANSQESQESEQSSILSNSQDIEKSGDTGKENPPGGEGVHINGWINDSTNLPRTTGEMLEMVQEFLGGDNPDTM